MNFFFNSVLERRLLSLLSVDLILSICVFSVSLAITGTDGFGNGPEFKFLKIKAMFFSLSVLSFSFFLEMYGLRRYVDNKLILVRSFLASFCSFFLLLLIYASMPYLAVSRSSLITALLLFMVFQSLWHFLFHALMRHPVLSNKVMVLGTGAKALSIGKLLEISQDNYKLHGYVTTDSEPMLAPESRVLGDLDSIVEIVRREHINTIVMALTEKRGNLPLDELMTCKLIGANVLDYPSFYELMTGKLPVEEIDPSWFVINQGFRVTKHLQLVKRLADLALASVALIVTAPVFFLLAIAIKIGSQGPVIYSQTRVCRMGKKFRIYKFRTMTHEEGEDSNVSWTSEEDDRITFIGKFLRKSHLDELPQLINVLKGDMSMIGPRPERPEFVNQIRKHVMYYDKRHFIKPGITGWAQVNYRYGASIGDSIEKLRYDLYYLKHVSLFLDILIMFETVKIVIFRQNGR